MNQNKVELFKYIVFKLIDWLISLIFRKQDRQKLAWDKFIDDILTPILEIINQIHYQLPQLNVKEVMIGFCISRSILFEPQFPDINNLPADKMSVIKLMGFRLAANNYREEAQVTSNRFIIYTYILFGILKDDPYLGHMF